MSVIKRLPTAYDARSQRSHHQPAALDDAMTRTPRPLPPLALTLLAATLVGGGCAITPSPSAAREIRRAADADTTRSKAETPALTGPR